MSVKKHLEDRTSLAAQWLSLCTSSAGVMGLFPGWGAENLHAAWCGQNE